MKPESIQQADLAVRYPQVRGATVALAQGLSAEDCALQFSGIRPARDAG